MHTKSYHSPSSGRPGSWRWFRVFLILILVGGLGWLVFGSKWLAIQDVKVSGAKLELEPAIRQEVLGHNLVLLRSKNFAAALEKKFPNFEQVLVEKNYPRGLKIQVSERQPTGVWCRGETCQFWDRSGARWGQTVASTGPLLLLVKDDRSEDFLDSNLLTNLLAIVDGLPKRGLAARRIALPDAEPGGAHILTDKKYEIYFDALGDVADQLAVLAVFLTDKTKDPAFAPRYIDLRTSGRVYFK